jgi:hypothetical protein
VEAGREADLPGAFSDQKKVSIIAQMTAKISQIQIGENTMIQDQ